MGSRASYILIEQGKTEIYRDRAYDIPVILLSGFARARIYIQHMRPWERLLYEDGGVLIDSDCRQLLFWGRDNDILLEPDTRRLFLSALRSLWPGWTVEWALYGDADLAKYLHIDYSLVSNYEECEPGFYQDNPISDDGLLHPRYSYYKSAVITIKLPDGLVFDYALACLPGSVLAVGPHLLDVLLSKGEPIILPHERGEQRSRGWVFRGGAFFDLTTHEMWVWRVATFDLRYLEALRQLWDGWRVNGHVDGIVRQVVLSGRDATPIMVPEDEAVAELIRGLAWWGTHNNVIVPIMTSNVPEGTDQIEIAPGFFAARDEIASVEKFQQILQRLFRTLL